MPRQRTGQVRTSVRKDGTITYSLRFRDQHGIRQVVTLGNQGDGWTEARARAELELTLARVKAGVWTAIAAEFGADPTFHEWASYWLAQKIPALKPKTEARYRWMLAHHLLAAFGHLRLTAIDAAAIDRYRTDKLIERQRLQAERQVGGSPRDEYGRPIRGLANRTINETIKLLAAILDDARDQTALQHNPAKDRRRRAKTQRDKTGVWLEPDEVRSMIEAAEQLDRAGARSPRSEQSTRDIVGLRDDLGLEWAEIAKRVGLSIPGAIYHYRKGAGGPRRPAASVRRAIVVTFAYTGLRASELCALTWDDVDFANLMIRVGDSKTPAGVRRIHMTPALGEELRTYRGSLVSVRAGSPVFPNRHGHHRTTDKINKNVVIPALERANANRRAAGLTPIPENVRSHAFRRTYITHQLEGQAPVPYVMEQVGHRSSKTTIDVYSRASRSAQRDQIAKRFDEIMVPRTSVLSDASTMITDRAEMAEQANGDVSGTPDWATERATAS